MKTRAAVAFEAKKPLEIVELDLDGQRPAKSWLKSRRPASCHTDAYTLDGLDSEGIFLRSSAMRRRIVREVGTGVISVKPGDHVIPL